MKTIPTSKEADVREALHGVGVEDSHAAKLHVPLSSMKSAPLPRPDCLTGVTEHLAKSSPPFVGLQVLYFHSAFPS